MAAQCKHCNENAYDCEEQVCKACGVVTEEIKFGSEFTPHRPARAKTHWSKTPPAGLKFGMDVLDNLSYIYSISSDLKAETLDLLKSVHSKRSFGRKQDIGIMAGCCLIHVQKKYGHFVSLTDLCGKLNCTKKQVFKFSKFLKLYYNECVKDDSVTESKDVDIPDEECDGGVQKFPDKLESIIQALLASAPQEDKTDLINKTTLLTKLAYACWVVTGRSPEGVISAAAYLCWKSMHPSRKTLTFKQFCSDFTLNYTKARPRVSELKEMLLKLGCKIPSMSNNYVTDKNVLFHLDYILKNSETLRNDLLPEEFTEEDIDKKEFLAFRKVRPRNEKSSSNGTEQNGYDPDMCASDIEISDTEISSYIRSEEQVLMIKALKARNNVDADHVDIGFSSEDSIQISDIE